MNKIFFAIAFFIILLGADLCSAATIEKAEFYTESQEKITDFNNVEDFEVRITFSPTKEKLSGKLYFAGYNTEGRLLFVENRTYSLSENEFSKEEQYSVRATGDLSYLKIFFWNIDFNPLLQAYDSRIITPYIREIPEIGEVLSIGIADGVPENPKISWYISVREDRGYIKKAEGESFTVEEGLENIYIKAKVTTEYGVFETQPALIGEIWNKRQDVQNIDNTQSFSNEEYVFYVDGKGYILLDVNQTETSKYLIMSQDNVALQAFTKNGKQSQIFSTDTNVIGEWLNSEYISTLPHEMQESINKEQKWKINIPMWDHSTQTSTTAGIVLPAVNEILKYKEKIGFLEDGGDSWWTRSPYGIRGGDGANIMEIRTSDGLVEITTKHSTAKSGIRPMFYADKDFFKRVKLDSAGSEVLKYVKHSDIYTKEQWESLIGKRVSVNIPRFINLCNSREYLVDNIGGYTVSVKLDGNEILKGNSQRLVLDKQKLPRGEHNLEITAIHNGREIYKKVKVLSVYSESKKNFNSHANPRGFAGYLGANNNKEFLEKAIASDAKICRTNIEWSNVEKTQKGVYSWSSMDNVVIPLLENDIEPVILLSYANPLYSGNIFYGKFRGLYTKEIIDGMAAYAREVAQHYLDMGYEIKYFEFWNEPNAELWFPCAPGHKFLSDAMDVTTHEIKKVLPNATVIGGALAGKDPKWMKSVAMTGYNGADAFSYHPYTSGSNWVEYIDTIDFRHELLDMSNTMLELGGWKESWITEYGASTAANDVYTISEKEQATEMVKEGVLADAAYQDANIYYCYRNGDYKEETFQGRFGVVDYYGEFKPAYYAISAFFDKTQGAFYLGSTQVSPNATSYIYAKEGKLFAVVWSLAEESISLEGENVKIFDMYGNQKAEELSEITLSDEPVYIEGLSAKWANKAVSNSITDIIDNNLTFLNLKAMSSCFIGISEYKLNDTLPDLGDLLLKNYNAVELILTESDITQEEKAALLFTVHKIGTVLSGYSALSKEAIDKENPQGRFSEIKNEIEKREMLKEGGMLPVSRAMLSYANKFIEFAEKAQNSDVTSEYKNSVVNVYKRIAEEILDMVSSYYVSENITGGNLLVQIPLMNTIDYTMGYFDTGSITISVYNNGKKDIENADIVMKDINGNIIGSENLTVAAGENTEVSISYSKISTESFVKSTGGAYYAEIAVIKNSELITSELEEICFSPNSGLFV